MHSDNSPEVTNFDLINEASNAINEGYLAVLDSLNEAVWRYRGDVALSPEDFEGITKDDVIVWLIEGLS